MTTPTMQLLAWADERGPDVARRTSLAIELAGRAHRGQYRRNGDPYIEHPIAVAVILVQHGADPETVIAGVLHDLPDTTDALPVADLRSEFGETVTALILAVAALDHTEQVPDAIDPRALHIKIAERVHTMRTIGFLAADKQYRKADHTRRLIAPLARTLGLADLATELDTLAAATLRAHSAPDLPGRLDRVPGARTLRCALTVGGLLLPAPHRHRLLQDWDGELHAAANLAERFRFATSVLLHLPHLAVLTRRTDHP